MAIARRIRSKIVHEISILFFGIQFVLIKNALTRRRSGFEINLFGIHIIQFFILNLCLNKR
jgi:hypothetical protein